MNNQNLNIYVDCDHSTEQPLSAGDYSSSDDISFSEQIEAETTAVPEFSSNRILNADYSVFHRLQSERGNPLAIAHRYQENTLDVIGKPKDERGEHYVNLNVIDTRSKCFTSSASSLKHKIEPPEHNYVPHEETQVYKRKRLSQTDYVDLTADSTDENDDSVSQVCLEECAMSSISTGDESAEVRIQIENNQCRETTSRDASIQDCRSETLLDKSQKFSTMKYMILLLTGKITYSVRDASRQIILCGMWKYQHRPGYAPQPFVLISDLSSDDDMKQLPIRSMFNGSFVHTFTKNEQIYNFVVEEKNVNISFFVNEAHSTTFSVKGIGTNMFGRFNLIGTASKVMKKDDLFYFLNMCKICEKSSSTMICHSGACESIYHGKSAKQKIAMTELLKPHLNNCDNFINTNDNDILEKQDAHSDDSTASSSKNPSFLANLNASENVQRYNYVGNTIFDSNRCFGRTIDHEQVNTVYLKALNTFSSYEARIYTVSKRKKVFDQMYQSYLCHDMHERMQDCKGRTKTGESMPIFLSKPCRLKILQESQSSKLNSDSHTVFKHWKDFGALSDLSGLSWMVNDIRPLLSKAALDYFKVIGISFVNDLLKADIIDMYLRLMTFPRFRLACAFTAWRSRVDFCQIFTLAVAKKTVLNWKHVAKSWWRLSTGGVDWDNQESLLKNIISSSEALLLESNFGIISANQLLMSNHQSILQRLCSIIEAGLHIHPQKEILRVCEGMLYSWMIRAEEVSNKPSIITSSMMNFNEVKGALLSCLKTKKNVTQLLAESHSTDVLSDCYALKAPLSYTDFLFITSESIQSDEQLSRIDPFLLAPRYATFLQKQYEPIPIQEALLVVKNWKLRALRVLGLTSNEDLPINSQNASRLHHVKASKNLIEMHKMPHLSRTLADDRNGGLPKRTLACYDNKHNVLYHFDVTVAASWCSPSSGNGAFLTYLGCRVLKNSSRWKRKSLSDIPPTPQTRKPLTAMFPGGVGATITIKGKEIHGDEHFYGPEDGVGIWNEFSFPDDFVEIDNITFSSKHAGCAMFELDRYAPLLPEDRKTDLLFSMKDFIFSFEPSSWRFDVKEELEGNQQVVDFTDDTTGSPHSVARSNMSMYVNEVGHDKNLIENVCPLESPRSVTYYIYIDVPMKKGEKVELLVNYGTHYEEIRERRGYGASSFNGLKSDEDDISRVLRNLKHRKLIEKSILSFTEEEITSVLNFFKTRVWGGIKSSTSSIKSEDSSIFLRQCVARRRLHWLSLVMRAHIVELFGKSNVHSSSISDVSQRHSCCGCIFHKGMIVFINNWMLDGDPRPGFSGLATITSISKDKYGRHSFQVSLPGSMKVIDSVPEAVVTIPTEKDFVNVSERVYSTWKKKMKDDSLPAMREQLVFILDTFRWNTSFLRDLHLSSLVNDSCVDVYNRLVHDLRWEWSEELLFLIQKHKRLLQPFDDMIWCPISQSLLQKSLQAMSEFLIPVEEGKKIHMLRDSLITLACDTATTIREVICNTAEESRNVSISDLSFLHDSRMLVTDGSKLSVIKVEEYNKNESTLDLEWYLASQVVLVVHSLASLIDWKEYKPGQMYSLDLLCHEVGIHSISCHLSLQHHEWQPFRDYFI